ncbi:MAG TPA: transcriptional repressor [Opitutae bacterium]|nr:transcriptional repressor [Opitutae bacterium]
MRLNTTDLERLKGSLKQAGLKPTRQREHVLSVLLARRDHPTVEEVWQRSRTLSRGISLATVYNCLESFVESGLVKQVNYEREPTRYCPNLRPHAHFKDQETGRVYDIDLPNEVLIQLNSILPEGFRPEAIEISFHGRTKQQAS